jgi:hypothetical protein
LHRTVGVDDDKDFPRIVLEKPDAVREGKAFAALRRIRSLRNGSTARARDCRRAIGAVVGHDHKAIARC